MAYRIIAKSPEDLNKIINNIKSWFKISQEYKATFKKETRKFQDEDTKEIVEKEIETIDTVDNFNKKQATIKFIPMRNSNELKLTISGDGVNVLIGKIKDKTLLGGLGSFKAYNKDKKTALKETIRQLIKTEIHKVINEIK